MTRKDLSRRMFLKASAMLAGVGALAACGATPTPQVVEKVVEKEVTKIVEGTPQVVKETAVVVETVVVKETVVVQPASSGPTFITYVTQYSGPPTNAADDQIIAQFEDKNPDVKVKKMTFPGQDPHDKLRIMATAGDLPDCFNIETKQVIDMISRGMCLDITDMFNAKSGLTKDDYWPGEWEKQFFKGKMYLLSLDTQDVIIFYNKDIFDKKGVPYPPKDWNDKEWTYEKMIETASKLVEGEGPNRIWGYDTSRWWVYSYPIIWSYGGLITNEDRTKSAITMPETIQALQMRADWINKYKITPTPAQATEGAESQFNSGRLAMRAVWSPWAWFIKDVPDLHWDIAVMPGGPAGRFTRCPQDGMCVGSQTKQADKAFRFSMYLAGPDGQALYDNQLGLGLPTIKKVALSEDYIHPKVKGLEHLDQTLVTEIYTGGHYKHQDVTIKWPEMDKLISANMDSLLDGKVTAEEFAKTLDPQITELLQSIPEEWRGWVGD